MTSLGNAAESGDRLLWAMASAVAGLAVTSVVLINFWPSGSWVEIDDDDVDQAALAEQAEFVAENAHSASATEVSDLVNRARLALDAGMLVRPADDSAWDLFAHAVDIDPSNVEARQGLVTVADRMILGVSDDAAERKVVADKILLRLPDHAGAKVLAKGESNRRAVASLAQEPGKEAAHDARRSSIDPVPELYEKFSEALDADRLVDDSRGDAREYVRYMSALNPTHELTLQARNQLFDAMMRKYDESFDALATNTAMRWLLDAEDLAVDGQRVEVERIRLTEFVNALDGTRPIPADDLTIIDYSDPQYPDGALAQGIEGWVDVNFTITRDGHTKDISVVAASHEELFTNEAVFAVALWQFEPFRVMDRPVDQRAYDRIRFALE